MERIELEEMLNGMDPAEKKLTLAVDDAMDKLWTYKLQRDYGVVVECNPGGDRSKIVIDGEVMDHERFNEWLMEKQGYDDCEDDDYEDEDYEEEDEEDEPEDVVKAFEKFLENVFKKN